MGEDIDADVTLGEFRMGFLEGLGRKVEGIPEHPFQFGPFTVLDVAGRGLKLPKEMSLACQSL